MSLTPFIIQFTQQILVGHVNNIVGVLTFGLDLDFFYYFILIYIIYKGIINATLTYTLCVCVLIVSDVHHNIPVYLRNLEAKPRFTTGKEDSDPRIVYRLEGKCLVHIFGRKKKNWPSENTWVSCCLRGCLYLTEV